MTRTAREEYMILERWISSRTNYWHIVIGGAVYFLTVYALDWKSLEQAWDQFSWLCGGVLFCYIRNRFGW